MKRSSSLFLLSILLLTCSNNTETIELINKDKQSDSSGKIQIDSNITAVMRYIAGLPTEKYAELQQENYYKAQLGEIEKTWQKINEKTIQPIKTWINEIKLTFENDTIPLFYPFSGPDFFYANYFFPYARTYIMFGLEDPGNLPDFNTIDKPLLRAYHKKLMVSMREINNLGFFSTKKMASQFADQNLDGSLHLILFYLGRCGHDIIRFSKIYIDQYGNVQEINFQNSAKSATQGVKIEFLEKDTNIVKTLYYLQVDISDSNLKRNTEFLHFINHFGEKNTFIKSASYLLHKNEYSLLRTNILTQSRKILQDDTGIPFTIIDNDDYNLRFFGKYAGTIGLFSSRFQPKLKLASENKSENHNLPFQLGYKASNGESLLMLITARARESEKVNKKLVFADIKIVYKVQIKASKKHLANYAKEFADFPNVGYYYHGGLFKYTIGEMVNRNSCGELLHQAINKGFRDAFVVAFVNGKRVALEDIKGNI